MFGGQKLVAVTKIEPGRHHFGSLAHLISKQAPQLSPLLNRAVLRAAVLVPYPWLYKLPYPQAPPAIWASIINSWVGITQKNYLTNWFSGAFMLTHCARGVTSSIESGMRINPAPIRAISRGAQRKKKKTNQGKPKNCHVLKQRQTFWKCEKESK